MATKYDTSPKSTVERVEQFCVAVLMTVFVGGIAAFALAMAVFGPWQIGVVFGLLAILMLGGLGRYVLEMWQEALS